MSKLRVVLLGVGALAAMTTLGACQPSTTTASHSPAASSASAQASGSAPASEPASSPGKAPASATGAAKVANGTQYVYVKSINSSTQVATLEPVKVENAEADCRKKGIPLTEERCMGLSVVESNTTIQVPVTAATTYYLAYSSDTTKNCLDSQGAGICKTTAGQFMKDINLEVVQVTIAGGVVTKFAVMGFDI
jgi:hypothetical protein